MSLPLRPWTRSRNTLPPVPPLWTFSSTPAAAVSLVVPPCTLPRSPGYWTCPRRHTPWSGPVRSRTGLPTSMSRAVVRVLSWGWWYLSRYLPGTHEGICGRGWWPWAGLYRFLWLKNQCIIDISTYIFIRLYHYDSSCHCMLHLISPNWLSLESSAHT